MKTRKIPLRTCVVTKEQLPKKDLLGVKIYKTKSIVILIYLTLKKKVYKI